MGRYNPKRSRGVILTFEGWTKFQTRKLEIEFRENSNRKYTLAEISERAGLSPNTVTKVLARLEGVDKQTLVRLFSAFDLELNKSDYSQSNPSWLRFQSLKMPKGIDLEEEISVEPFYGRTAELTLVKRWLIEDRCQVIAILGMGGIGKTFFTAKLINDIQGEFDYVIWRSLYNSPPLFELLANLIQFFAKDDISPVELPKSIDERILQLMTYLRQYKCLIVLDNFQSILQSGVIAGSYREECEDYSQLIKRVGQTIHQSCLILTSREKAKDIASLEGEQLKVRSLKLKGIQEEDGKRIFHHKGLSLEDSKNQKLIERYSGNPLTLNIVATTIVDVFNGNVSDFLNQNVTVFGDIYVLLEEQFARLSDLEYEVMYWLAIHR